MILVLDNYDSFTYNLVQYIGEFEPELKVIRNDQISVKNLLDLNPSHIVISPGPCTPTEAGISVELIQQTPSHIPLLGVCLGHQSIAEAFGGNVIGAPYLMHGKTSKIHHNQSGIFQSIPNDFTATRYHSLIVEKSSLPNDLIVDAQTSDNIIMAFHHCERPIYGVQFHPESIMTEHGKTMIQNFIQLKGNQS